MTWTYDSSDLSSDLAKVRLYIGDTQDLTSDDESLTDEEIQIALDETSDTHQAAVRAMEYLIAKLRRVVTRSASGMNSSQGDKLRQALDTYKILLKRAGKGQIHAYGGMMDQDRLDDADDDDDFPQPDFKIGMDDKES